MVGQHRGPEKPLLQMHFAEYGSHLPALPPQPPGHVFHWQLSPVNLGSQTHRPFCPLQVPWPEQPEDALQKDFSQWGPEKPSAQAQAPPEQVQSTQKRPLQSTA